MEGEQAAAASDLGSRSGRGIKTERLREYLAVVKVLRVCGMRPREPRAN
jgi:hypothetical protein